MQGGWKAHRHGTTSMNAAGADLMRRWCLYFAAASILWLTAWHDAMAETEVVVFCIDNYPPYSYEVNGRAEGIYPAIFRRAFSRMDGYRVTLLSIPWKRGLHYLKRGEGFAIAPVYYKPELRPYIWPYSIPVLRQEEVLLCRERVLAVRNGHRWPEGFYGLTIGKNAGYATGGTVFNEAVARGDIFLSEAKSNRINLMKLGLGRTDCYLNDGLSISWELDQLRNEGLLDEGGQHASLGEPISIHEEWGHLGVTRMDFGRYHFKTDFLAQLNGILAAMQAKGEIRDIVEGIMGAPCHKGP
ncbi:polar amino acid transport system substrate-binding protein [Desulfoluna spongiiphila]|uniref:Polar amino acid transport system substrate-binding protein n=2 Tax=Desulfoluna spongiiphila TaxID=419481 RepID=A0A1G5H9P5_9BACT|nr:polar amino acid transport system substrate-binding protein [Desulfoluna spongiiphila]